jgi:hypothetical protein
MLTLGPFREEDLTNTWQAVRAHGERILGYTRLPAARIVATAHGLVLNQSGAGRKWCPSGPLESCHLLDVNVSDDYIVHTLISHQVANVPAGDYIAICPGYNLAAAAQYLRVECLGRHLHLYTAPQIHATITAAALKIPKRPANDNRLPGVSEIPSGTLFKFDADSSIAATDYFNLPASLDCTEPVVIELGAESCLVLARAPGSTESMRIIIARELFVPTATKELLRWLKSNRKEIVK